LRKGKTHVALYGLGSMRDERLNRMWRGEHLTFSRPAEDHNGNNNNNDGEEDNGAPQWFNIFTLHQNRDRGRGTKNCIKEDMIPDWMDFICWGHEHECDIEVTESVVGTFRISQPGSSVATSLVEGESMRKKNWNFRYTRRSIPINNGPINTGSLVRIGNGPFSGCTQT